MRLAADLNARAGIRVAARATYIGLLVLAIVAPPLRSNGLEFPGVSNGWVLLVFAALAVVPLLEEGRALCIRHLDALILALPAAALALEQLPRERPMFALYLSLSYLALRSFAVARSRAGRHRPGRPVVPRSWLVVGIAALACVHVGWAWQTPVTNDSAQGGVQGATRILEGRNVYGSGATAAAAPHGDVYAPLLYEAYLPFTGKVGGKPASRLLSAAAELLCALLLFALGSKIGGRATGLLLAFCWLAYPLTLDEDALGFNDGLVAAALLGTLLLAHAPGKRGALAAAAGWLKFTPLALLPLLASYRGGGRARSRRLLAFGAGFAAITAVVFVPIALHDSPATFIARTLGFRGTREPADSLWSAAEVEWGASLPALAAAARVAHGLVVAIAAALTLFAPRLLRRNDEIGLAAMCATILIAVQLGLSYYSYSYVLWFAPLIFVGLFAGGAETVHARSRVPAALPA